MSSLSQTSASIIEDNVDNEIMILLGLKINRHMITSDSYLIISEKVNDVKVFVPFHNI